MQTSRAAAGAQNSLCARVICNMCTSLPFLPDLARGEVGFDCVAADVGEGIKLAGVLLGVVRWTGGGSRPDDRVRASVQA